MTTSYNGSLAKNVIALSPASSATAGGTFLLKLRDSESPWLGIMALPSDLKE